MKKKRLGQTINCVIILACIYVIGACGFKIFPLLGQSIHHESVNTTLLSLSIGYLTGYCIYLFTYIIPRGQREHEVMEYWDKPLMDIYSNIDVLISQLLIFMNLNKDNILNITEVQCGGLVKMPLRHSGYRILAEYDYPNRSTTAITDLFSYPITPRNKCAAIKAQIDHLLKGPLVQSAPIRLIDLLYRIKESPLIESYVRISSQPITTSFGVKIETFSMPDMPKFFVSFISLYQELKQYPFAKGVDYRAKTIEDDDTASSTERLMKILNIKQRKDGESSEQRDE